MALNKVQLVASMEAIFDRVSPEASGITDPELLRHQVASDLADAIEVFVKSGTVTVQAGIAVSTAGTAAAQTGATTATGTGSIS